MSSLVNGLLSALPLVMVVVAVLVLWLIYEWVELER